MIRQLCWRLGELAIRSIYLLVALSLYADVLSAGTMWTGSTSAALAVHPDPLLNPNTSSLQLLDSETISDVLSGGFKTLEKSWSLGVTARGSVTAIGGFRFKSGGTELNLGVEAFASSGVSVDLEFLGPAFGSSLVSVTSEFNDTVRLVRLRADGTLPIDRRLLFSFNFEGDFHPFTAEGGGREARADAILQFGGNGGQGFVRYEYMSNAFLEQGERQVSATAEFFATLDDDSIVGWNVLFGASARSSFNTSITAGFKHTAALVAITFADGTTPEERGFSLEFESGLTSPNLVDHSDTESVPEPSSCVAWMCGVAALVAVPRLRRRRTARDRDTREPYA